MHNINKKLNISSRCAKSSCALSALLLVLLFGPQVYAQTNGDVVIITGEDISRMQANTMADVLNHVAGITAGESSVGIHGSYKVKVFLDGRPINDPTSSHGGINWNLVNLEQVEEIQILRGKGSVRYGQDASGGVILITTRQVSSLSGHIKTYGGNLDTGYGSAQVQAKKGAYSAAFSGETEFTQGYRENNDKHRYKAGIKTTYTHDQDRYISLGADYLYDTRGLAGFLDHPTPYSRKKTKTTALTAQAQYLQTTSTTFYNDGYRHNSDVSRDFSQTLRVYELGEDLSTSSKTGEIGELSYGAGYRRNWATGSNLDAQSEETFSLYGSQRFEKDEFPLFFTLGLRANANTDFDDTLSPEAKLGYHKETWSLTLAYSASANIPSLYQRYNQSSSTMPNPDLDIETSDNYSLSWHRDFNKQISLMGTFFYNQLTDRITYVTGDDGIGQYENFGEVTYRGGDLALSWQATEKLSLKASYTYLKARDEETDLTIPAKSEHKATADLYYKASDRLMTVLSSKYVSEAYRDRSNTIVIPDYFLMDARAEYDLGKIALFTEIKNLLNCSYSYADGLPAPPRTWILGMTWDI
ncbi:TonB-dependent receptor plug domain-containing protein [Desulfogranum japonicum]|uniref:TonB-dependent receptor plug domain-containing protein n=1 Tax=Desulfogranum japonicum TaxID=231447 RepID=UPI00040966DD|nr:TonB-dependent receptor [Desulfogranum japonicum]